MSEIYGHLISDMKLPFGQITDGKDFHLLYGSVVMVLMMKIRNLFLFFHNTYCIRTWLVHAYPFLHPVICTGFLRITLPMTSLVLIFVGPDCMFSDMTYIFLKTVAPALMSLN